MPFWTIEDHIRLDKKNMIAKGTFTKAYKINEKEVIILTVDNTKECLALFCKGVNIPKMERLEDIGEYQVYKMPLYKKLKSTDKLAWSDYKKLRKLFQCKSFTKHKCYEEMRALLEDSGLPNHLVESLESILDAMAMYTDEMFFDVFPRNFGVDDNGNLMLLDIACDVNKLTEVWEQKRKKRECYA